MKCITSYLNCNGKSKETATRAAVKFRRENPRSYFMICSLISRMANYIRKSGAPEVTVGIDKYGEYYESANQ